MYSPKCSQQEVRNGIAEYFRNTADFRRRRAEQYPGDSRNVQSAEALDRVAGYCLTLADDDDQLARLFAMPMYFFEGGLFTSPCVDHVSQSVSIAVGCGYSGAIDPAEFLVGWIDALAADYPEYVKRMNEYSGPDESGH